MPSQIQWRLRSADPKKPTVGLPAGGLGSLLVGARNAPRPLTTIPLVDLTVCVSVAWEMASESKGDQARQHD